MSTRLKKFSIRPWLTIPEASEYLSITMEEPVSEADLLRFALDGMLQLSANFFNGVAVTPAAYTSIDQIGLPVDSEEVFAIDGVFDLPMKGNERHDVEQRYQSLIGGVGVTSALIERVLIVYNNDLVQIVEPKSVVVGLSKMHHHKRETYEKLLSNEAKETLFYRADHLPLNCDLVIRMGALKELESRFLNRAVSDGSTDGRAHVSNKLAFLNQAANRFWANADKEDRDTHPTNKQVEEYLIRTGKYSQTLAEKAASIIRPEWAPVGRKKEN